MKTFRSALVLFIAALIFIPASAEATTPMNQLTSATGSANFDNGNNEQVWHWNSLGSVSYGLLLTGTSTSPANGNNGTLVVQMSGSGGIGSSTEAILINGGAGGANTTAYGLFSEVSGTSKNSYSIYGLTITTNNGDAGVWGDATGTSGATYGIYGTNASSTGYAGYFNNSAGGYAAAFMGGNVGIGTATPVNALDIGTSGGVHIASGIPGSTSMALYNNSGTLTWNGVALATGSSVSGTTNYIPVFTGSSSLGNSVIYQSGSSVGIGTAAPQSLVHAYGGEVQVGSSGASCAAARGGAIRFSGSTLYYCDGASTWQTVGGGGSGTVTSSTAGQVAYYQSTGATVIGTSTMNVVGGNVGVNTASPTNLLSLGGQSAQTIWMERNTTSNTAGNNLTLQASGATSGATNKNGGNLVLSSGASTGAGTSNMLFNVYPGTAGSTADNTAVTAMTIAGNGYVGVGTSSLAATPFAIVGDKTGANNPQLSIVGNSNSYLNLFIGFDTSNNYGWLQAVHWTQGYPAFSLQPNGGSVGVGVTAPSYTLQVNGSVAGTSAYVNTSDIRRKKNVRPLDAGLNIVAQLKPVSFEWKEEVLREHAKAIGAKNVQPPPPDPAMQGKQMGFIAQDVEKILPSVVVTEPDAEKTKGMKYSELIPVLTKAIQELKADNDNLHREVAELKSGVATRKR
jgi:hypothetical protein